MRHQGIQSEAKSRQEQVLLLAAEGLTDKEIAARLNLSAETVGTYWRRVMSRHGASSRTEVVAKVIRQQAEMRLKDLQHEMDCLRQVADHLIEELRPSARGATAPDLIMAALPDLIIQFDSQFRVLFTNATENELDLRVGDSLEKVLDGGCLEWVRKQLKAISPGASPDCLLKFGQTTRAARMCRVPTSPATFLLRVLPSH